MSKPPASLWSLAFRPFFLAAAIWAALALALWIVVFMTGGILPSRFDPLSWHIHAMLFGFVPAAIAGFMLTAIPNWTGRPPIQGGRLIALVLLWLLGRIACLVSATMPLWMAAAADLAFPVMLCAVATREIVAARNWRNLIMPVPIAVLAIANLLMYLELAGYDLRAGLGWRLGIVAIIALISAIGGRIIPAFTRNWLVKRGVTVLPAARDVIDRLALAVLHTGLLGWAIFPTSKPVGAILVAGAVLNLWRLCRWRGFATIAEPLLAILHVGYAWVILGAAFLGASLLTNIVPEAAAIHAFTAGAIGTMVLAVMTRVARGHTGRALEADRVTTLIYAMITVAGLSRIAAAFAVSYAVPVLDLSALLWVMSFLLFAAIYGPMLVSPRIS
ncbi:MAG: NnrS family protein [Pseudomonadota bacterium]|mgnify:FL=1|nr:NnrS family protein [Phenylobacterium sp.]